MAKHMALIVAKILFAQIVMEKEGFDMTDILITLILAGVVVVVWALAIVGLFWTWWSIREIFND